MKSRPSFPAKLDTSPPRKMVKPSSPVTWADTRQLKPDSLVASSAVGLGLDSETVRLAMVKRLSEAGVEDEMVLKALLKVERHQFLDTALANQAYEDTSLPIGFGQTISKPSVVARMIELLRQGKNLKITGKLGRVLEIGTGCGYQAALLSYVSQEVYSIERIKGLYERARVIIRPLRLGNLHLLFGDGTQGYAAGAPYAGIIAAAGGENIPTEWIEQLADGGRLVAPMSVTKGSQSLVVIDKTFSGTQKTVLEQVNFVPLVSGTL